MVKKQFCRYTAFCARNITTKKDIDMKSVYQQLFLNGANNLASFTQEYTEQVQAAGFSQEEWDLLTEKKCWTPQQRQQISGVIAAAVSITLTIAGLPATRMPGAFVAAIICKLVEPCNRPVAAMHAPASFDALSAVGLTREVEIIQTPPEQMMALVLHFSSREFQKLINVTVDEFIEEEVLRLQN